MKDFKGTGKDWMLVQRDRITYVTNEDVVVIAELDYQGALGFNKPTPMTVDANAKLIAAAPELLKALQESTKDLIISHGHVCSELRNNQFQWKGVDKIILERIESNKLVINKAL